jgi:hypothetical protein
MSPTKTQ